MKKVVFSCVYLLFGLTTIFPFGMLVSAILGYTFELTSISSVSVIIAITSVFTVIFSIVSKDKISNKYLLYTLTPLSFINAVIYIFESGQVSVSVCVLISFLCISFLIIKNATVKAGKFVVLIFCTLANVFILFFSFVMLTFGSIGQNTVVKSIDSPSGNLYVQIVDSDQGALGGGTIVDVYEKREIDVGVFKLKDKPQRVYIGEWREYENMQISWKDDDCLVVNSAEYEIE